MKDELTDRDIDHYEKTGEYPAGWSAWAFRFEITKLARLGRGGQALPPEAATTKYAEADVEKLLEGFDRHIFVREIASDYEPGWHLKLVPYLGALGRLVQQREPQEER